MKRERNEATEVAEDQEELSKTLNLTLDRRQGYEDALMAQVRELGGVPIAWCDFCART